MSSETSKGQMNSYTYQSEVHKQARVPVVQLTLPAEEDTRSVSISLLLRRQFGRSINITRNAI